MKMLMMLMLASGMVTVSAHAEVGKDKTAPNCQQVIQTIQDTLKKNHPVTDSAPAANAPAATGASSAQ